MTSHDLRDVLNLPSDHAGPKPSRKQKTSLSRTNLKGLAREVQNLGGDNPIAIVPDAHIFKKRRLVSRKPAARWELRVFKNSARGDDGALLLRHWRRKAGDGVEPDSATSVRATVEDSSFAKYNVRVEVPQYSEEQYGSLLQSDDWSKEETDYLMAMAKEFDLRWPILWDRYQFGGGEVKRVEVEADSTAMVPGPRARTMEDLKARYYQVAAKLMAAQKPAQYMSRPEFDLYDMMQNFRPGQERVRKEFAIKTMSRSREEAQEEETLLVEIQRILERTARFNLDRRELYQRLDFPSTETDINAFRSSTGLQTLLQNLMNVDKSKKRRRLTGPGEGTSPAGVAGGGPFSESGHDGRETVVASAGRRDSLATPATPSETAAAERRKKSGGGSAVLEHRKMSEQEEQVYGLSYHDRLPSGPTFRYEKINKLYSHKSGQQQARITNMLCELDIPPRLSMPTAAVTVQFEVLWGAVTSLLDLRKVNDKMEAEIRLEEAKKVERDRARASQQADVALPTAAKASARAGDAAEAPSRLKAPQDGLLNAPTSVATASGGPVDAAQAQRKSAAPDGSPRGGGALKRSASVLSNASDGAGKRQKK